MKIALFSDIHANLPALEKGYARASRMGSEKFISCGDMIGGGPFPMETIQFIRANGITCIRGNIERKILERSAKKHAKKKFSDDKKGNLLWTASHLGPEEMQWLGSLSADLYFTESEVRIKVVHGSPKSDTDYIYPSVTKEGLLRRLDLDLTDVLACGHSHIPFVKNVSGLLVVNCGSMGRPVDGDYAGSFAILEIIKPGSAKGRIVRFKYSLETLISGIKKTKTPGVLIEEYMLGIKIKGA